jgi:hypothetical protein
VQGLQDAEMHELNEVKKKKVMSQQETDGDIFIQYKSIQADQ